MDAQQLATKVSQLDSRVATLEDEGKIVKGEVKQILTEIRNTILARDNPFEHESAPVRSQPPEPVQISRTIIEMAPVPLHEALKSRSEPEPSDEPTPAHDPEPQPEAAHGREPIMLRPTAQPMATPPPEPQQPQWSLLTIAGLAAWAEDAMRKLGSLRLEILLDLCEAAGHLPAEARLALARVTELDIPEPTQAPSTNETVAILRQLDALVNDDEDYASTRTQRRI